MATNMLLEAADAAALLAGLSASGASSTSGTSSAPGTDYPDLTQSPFPPSAPVPGDLWLREITADPTANWPLNIYMDDGWVKQGEFDPLARVLHYHSYPPDDSSGGGTGGGGTGGGGTGGGGTVTTTTINIDEITKASSPPDPADVSDGDIWWQEVSGGLVQHVFLDGGWRETGMRFDSLTNVLTPVQVSTGLGYDSAGALENTAPATAVPTSPVTGSGAGPAAGDIVIALDDPLPAHYIELNGALIFNGATVYPQIAQRYPWMVTGTSIHLPDFRGMVLRHLDPIGVRDKETTLRWARAGDGATGASVGTYQPDVVGQHSHDVAVNYVAASSQGVPPGDMAMGQYNDTHGPTDDGSTQVQSPTTVDNRMFNVAVRYCLVAG